MIRYALIIWSIVFFIVILSGCGIAKWGIATVPSQFSLDGVKRISPGVTTDDTSTWGQDTYQVGPDSRLLLRFESLGTHTSRIDTSSSKKVEIQLTLSDETQMATALTVLKLCPLIRNWMMLASWELAHPFMGGDKWATPGADFESAGCIFGTAVSGSTKSLTFDETQWFIDYPKGRATNYGLLAISAQTIGIVGDRSGSFSPRISFQEY